MVLISSKTGLKRGGPKVHAVIGLLMKKHQNRHKKAFFDVMSEVQKDLKDVSTGIGQFLKNPIYKNFVWNLMSKSERSTLTLPGRIRVKAYLAACNSDLYILICI